MKLPPNFFRHFTLMFRYSNPAADTPSCRLACVSVSSSDLNRLVMDYLVIEGYKTAAEEFSKEANLAPPIDLDSIETRMSIREAVQRGEVEEAIAKVNDLDAEVSSPFPRCIFPHGSLLQVGHGLRASATDENLLI
jgi:hypothetical protein